MATIDDVYNLMTDSTAGLAALHTKMNALLGVPGSIECNITIRDNATNPVDGAEVWVSTDADGLDVIAGVLNTNSSGRVTFSLDAGTYYVWASRSGINITNPTVIVVS